MAYWHVANDGGYSALVSVTPTVEATPDYASGDVLGGLMSVSAPRYPGGAGILHYLSISIKVDLAPIMNIVLFKSNPSATTFTENSALSLNAADYDKVLDVIPIVAADYFDLGTPRIARTRNLGIIFDPGASDTVLYACALAGEAINLASASDLTFNFGILQD